MSVSSEIAPAGSETTMTALAWLMFDGVGGSFGGWVSARLYHQYGGAYTYWIFGWMSIVSTVVIGSLQVGTNNSAKGSLKVSVL